MVSPPRESRAWLARFAPALLLVTLLVKLLAWAELLQWPALGLLPAIATAATLLWLGCPLPLLSFRWRYGMALGLNAVITALAQADVLHVRYFGDILSWPDLSRAGQLPLALSSVPSVFRAIDLLCWVDLLIGLGAWSWLARRAPAARPSGRLSAALAALALALTFPVAWEIARDPDERYRYAFTRSDIVHGIGLLPYHLYDLAVQGWFAGWGRLSTPAKEAADARRYVAQWQDSEPLPSELFGVAAGLNVIFLMAESLQDFPIGARVAGQPIAPALEAFARESLRFTEVYDQTHLGTTADGEFTSLQSLHPLAAGAVSTRYPTNRFHALPAVLARRGYGTLSAVGEPADDWNMRQMHPNLGFQRSYFRRDFRADRPFGIGIPDGELFPQLAQLLSAQRPPFFAYAISLSNHSPFQLPSEQRTLQLGELEGTRLGGYLHTVSYFDRAFGALVTSLRESGLLDRSLVVVYGDHSAALGSPPELGKLLGIAPWDELARWKADKKIPLLIRLPQGRAAGSRHTAGGQLDIAPTVLSLLGIPPSELPGLGRDLIRPDERMVVFRDGSFLDGSQLFLRKPSGEPLAFDLSRGQPVDPAGLKDRARAAQERLRISDLLIRADLIRPAPAP